jgi:guanylate kinase
MRKLPLVLVGPSGSGKSTLAGFLLQSFPQHFEFSVSSTTRKMRVGETHGKSYFFISTEEFRKKIERNEFAEWAEVHGNYYGTTKKAIFAIGEMGKIGLLDIDVQGVVNLNKTGLKFNSVCIVPKSEESVRKRLVKRGTESEEIIRRRMENMRAELRVMKENPSIFSEFIINDTLEKAKTDLVQILRSKYIELAESKI